MKKLLRRHLCTEFVWAYIFSSFEEIPSTFACHHMVRICLVLQENHQNHTKVALSSCISTSNEWECSTSLLQHLILLMFLILAIVNRWVVVSHWCFKPYTFFFSLSISVTATTTKRPAVVFRKLACSGQLARIVSIINPVFHPLWLTILTIIWICVQGYLATVL